MTRRFWTDAELQIVRSCRPKEAARRLGLSRGGVGYWRLKLGIARARREVSPALIGRYLARGWNSGMIAHATGFDTSTIRKARIRLGLPGNRDTPAIRAWRKQRLLAAARRRGVDRFVEIRMLRDRMAAVADGWPAGATRKAAEVLAVIETRGPCTRRELAVAGAFTTDRVHHWMEKFIALGWVAAGPPVGRFQRWSLAPEVAARRAAKREAAA